MHRRREKDIILVGFMGTGKSSTARELSLLTGRLLLDTDREIARREGLSIPAIFEKYGESYFRRRETEIISGLKNHRPGTLVVDTGGGAVLAEENRRLLRSRGVVFWLTASPRDILKRTESNGGEERPLLNHPRPGERIASLLEEREECYREASHFSVDTGGKSPREVAAEILEVIKSSCNY